jgi:hypothetical protein
MKQFEVVTFGEQGKVEWNIKQHFHFLFFKLLIICSYFLTSIVFTYYFCD